MCIHIYIYIYICHIFREHRAKHLMLGLRRRAAAFRCCTATGLRETRLALDILGLFGSSGMWCLRMLGLKIIVSRPSKTEGVGTSRLKLIWARGFEHSILKPHILKHHIPEHPSCGQAPVGSASLDPVTQTTLRRLSIPSWIVLSPLFNSTHDLRICIDSIHVLLNSYLLNSIIVLRDLYQFNSCTEFNACNPSIYLSYPSLSYPILFNSIHVHPVSITRFLSFRTQTLEHLSRYL